MSARDILRSTEKSALIKNQIISNVVGKKSKKSGGRKGKISAAAFITAIIVIVVVFFSSGNLIPAAISDRLIESTDVQYADAVESKAVVFQQALATGDVPDNTAAKLRENNVLVGYINENGDFVEVNKANFSLGLKIGDKFIDANSFINEFNNNVSLYDAFNEATYSRAAYYYDDSAKTVFRKIGTNRNNFSDEEDFEETMSDIVGKGSNININSVSLVEKQRTNEQGNAETYYAYEENGTSASSSQYSAEDLINSVSNKNTASSSAEATLATANTINIADKISKEQKSSLFFLAFMENISKMKAGEGSDSRVNEAMNYLYKSSDSEVVDVDTGELIPVSGSMLESPSLYAILSDENMNVSDVKNYSSDRILKTVENQLGASDAYSSINNTVASSSNKISGSIGRLNTGNETASSEILNIVSPTISSSLINNSFDDINGGIYGGELLVEGAVNVGKSLAKASGATAGDDYAVKSYARLTGSILALDAEVDRMNRSPFDITSKNTFLGSIIYKFAIGIRNNNTFLGRALSFSSVVSNSILGILPTSHADDSKNSYLTNFGDCETINNIGAVGSASCSEIATFDTSTLDNIFNDAGFLEFINNNTTLDGNGKRTINQGSVLAKFILYNNERVTPIGVIDGGILNSLKQELSSITPQFNILSMVESLLSSSDNNDRIASGAAFVNSSSNPDWATYKYAQRYVSLARATESLRQYDGSSVAYNNLYGFEGDENPVVAFLNNYYMLANR